MPKSIATFQLSSIRQRQPPNMKELRLILLLMLLAATQMATGGPVLDSIYVVVKLANNGDARVVTKCVVTADVESSECFIPVNIPEGSQLKNFNVSRENENYYLKNSPTWDTRWSRYDKLNKCAIEARGDNNYVMHWGLSENGTRKFYIFYNITGLLRGFSDSDGFCHEFVSPGIYPLPQHAEVIVYCEESAFTPDNAEVWAKGFEGKTIVSKTGSIYARGENPFDQENLMVIAVRFKKGLFTPELATEARFNDYAKDIIDNHTNTHHPTPTTQHNSIFYIAIAVASILAIVLLIATLFFAIRVLRNRF